LVYQKRRLTLLGLERRVLAAVLFRVASIAAPVRSGGDVSVMSAFHQAELLALDLVRTMTMAVVAMAVTMVAVAVRAVPLLQMLVVLAALQLAAAEMAGLTAVAALMAAVVVMSSVVGLKGVLVATALPLVIA
jgi:hypothetical protein